VKNIQSICIALALSAAITQVGYAARIKDLTSVKGERDNQLHGIGLVVGLAGTGDGKIEQTERSVINFLKKEFDLEIIRSDKSRNVAAVFVTADIGPYAKEGSRIDVMVSSAGDAASLQGGTLLQTRLFGADKQMYAVAQGPIAVGGFLGGNPDQGAGIQINHPSNGVITNGAIVEREIPMELVNIDGSLDLLINNPDAATAARIAEAINQFYPASSLAMDLGTVNVRVPALYRPQVTNFLAAIGSLDVTPDVPARIVINERTGTIVATQNVRISKVAVSHGSITVAIEREQQAVQPGPRAPDGAQTVVLDGQNVTVKEKVGNFQIIDEELSNIPPDLQPQYKDLPTLDRLTTALNAMGVTTREMTAILQAMKKAGALHAELILN
jgi:flagellar P-ring protein precursor FlgI